MSLQEIAILAALSVLLGWITRKGQRENLLLIFSVLLVYWLQPKSSLRYLDFWLPTATLCLTILSWAVTTRPEIRKSNNNFFASLLVLFLVIGLSLVRYFDFKGLLEYLHPPRIEYIILILLPILGLFLILTKTKKTSPILLWTSLIGLIVIFIIIKTPFLSYKASFIWRTLVEQSTALTRNDEIRWLGFSYLAFRILHTIRDKQTDRLPDIMLREYLTYIVFFPSLVAGPIARAENFIKEITQVTGTYREDLIKGTERIIIGSFKKFVVADSLAIIALNNQNADQVTSAIGSWVILYAFSFQILFDFSGYTDIAIGLGNFLNIQLPENFNNPYRRTNLTQFWNNWHMTLTNWFRSYFFNPLTRLMRKKKYSALLILFVSQISTMVLVGLWHGITINFIIWGLWHGLGLLIQNRWSSFAKHNLAIFDEKPLTKSFMSTLGIIFTFHYVALGWIWFVLSSPYQGWNFLLSLFGAV